MLRSRLRTVCALVGYASLWLVTLLLVALAVSAAAAGVYRSFRTTGLAGNCRGLSGGHCGSDPSLDVASASSAYEGYPWADEFWREARQRHQSARELYEPYRMWKPEPWAGKWFNIEHTATGNWRPASTAGADCGGQRVTVWVFGGSSGLGVPDSDTVTAYLAQEIARRRGQCVIAHDFGVEGFMSTQEVLNLVEQLRRNAPPDLVVFLDGYNDAYCGSRFYQTGPAAHCELPTIRQRIQGPLESPWMLWLRQSSLLRALQGLSGGSRSPRHPPTSYAEEVVGSYAANLAMVKKLAQAERFEAYFFWQPTLLYGGKRTDHFEQFAVQTLQLPSRELIAPVYDAAKQRAQGADFIFLGDLFRDESQPLFLDLVNLGPRGNHALAKAMADHIGVQKYVRN
ncbi:MAG: hypothetical protein M3P27_11575 [Acidobacteriota bacterium]|nr:hypothetical protein [Acidobacteriota bacterium]